MICYKCKNELTQDMFQSGMCFNCGCDISQTIYEQEKQKIANETKQLQKMKEQQLIKENQHIEMINNILLTTAPYVDGCKIVKHCGLVFGDTIFKLSLTNRISASIDDFSDAISFGDKELSGSTRLLIKAREYAIKKMKEEAVKRGANAIIGVDSDGTFGSGINHVTISGTAVIIEKYDK